MIYITHIHPFVYIHCAHVLPPRLYEARMSVDLRIVSARRTHTSWRATRTFIPEFHSACMRLANASSAAISPSTTAALRSENPVCGASGACRYGQRGWHGLQAVHECSEGTYRSAHARANLFTVILARSAHA